MASHTDSCIADAARFGFCEHTTLRPPRYRDTDRTRRYPPPPRSQLPRRLLSRHQRHVIELLSWTGFLLLVGVTIWLTLALSWLGLVAVTLTGLGWLLIFLAGGLPRGLTADLSRVLPPDTAERLAAPPPQAPGPAKTKGPGRHRRSGPSHPS